MENDPIIIINTHSNCFTDYCLLVAAVVLTSNHLVFHVMKQIRRVFDSN